MLSIMAQEFWDIQTVCDAGPRDFKPPPKVASRVLSFRPRKTNISNPQEYLTFVKAAFKQRRRILKTNLQQLGTSYDLNLLLEWLNKNNKADKVRAEELSVTELNSLFHFLKIK